MSHVLMTQRKKNARIARIFSFYPTGKFFLFYFLFFVPSSDVGHLIFFFFSANKYIRQIVQVMQPSESDRISRHFLSKHTPKTVSKRERISNSCT